MVVCAGLLTRTSRLKAGHSRHRARRTLTSRGRYPYHLGVSLTTLGDPLTFPPSHQHAGQEFHQAGQLISLNMAQALKDLTIQVSNNEKRL